MTSICRNHTVTARQKKKEIKNQESDRQCSEKHLSLKYLVVSDKPYLVGSPSSPAADDRAGPITTTRDFFFNPGLPREVQ